MWVFQFCLYISSFIPLMLFYLLSDAAPITVLKSHVFVACIAGGWNWHSCNAEVKNVWMFVFVLSVHLNDPVLKHGKELCLLGFTIQWGLWFVALNCRCPAQVSAKCGWSSPSPRQESAPLCLWLCLLILNIWHIQACLTISVMQQKSSFTRRKTVTIKIMLTLQQINLFQNL